MQSHKALSAIDRDSENMTTALSFVDKFLPSVWAKFTGPRGTVNDPHVFSRSSELEDHEAILHCGWRQYPSARSPRVRSESIFEQIHDAVMIRIRIVLTGSGILRASEMKRAPSGQRVDSRLFSTCAP